MKRDVGSSVGWWRGASLLLVVVLMVWGSVVPSHAMPQTGVPPPPPRSSAAAAAAEAAAEAERTEDRSSNPVFNVLEFARVNDPSSLLPGPTSRIPPPPQHSPAAGAAPPPGVLSDVPISSDPANPNSQQSQSPCVWAIISCCHGTSSSTSNIRQQCFTTHNCHGAWFEDLCSEEFVRSTQEILSQNVFGENIFGGAF